MSSEHDSAGTYPASGIFKEAYSTDLLFLIDTTGSMANQINAAKEQIKSIVSSITTAFNKEAELRVAVVGYKDHGDVPNIQFLDFTPSADDVRSFLATLQASGGDDIPEDVLGGIKQGLNASWKHQTRCVIHITDAPPHGRNLHDLGDQNDHFPNPGSEPHGLTFEPLLRQMVGMNVSYALLRTNGMTDRMVLEFGKHYTAASASCVLHPSNIYYSQFSGGVNADAFLLFEEVELGTAFSALEHLVVRVVKASAPRTALRMLGSAVRKKKVVNGEEVELETQPPEWDSEEWFDQKLTVVSLSSNIAPADSGTLERMLANDEDIVINARELNISMRSKPSAHDKDTGSLASYAKTAASTNRFVLKSYKQAGLGNEDFAYIMENMRLESLCKALSVEFNVFSKEETQIDFVVSTALRTKPGEGVPDEPEECMALEPFVDGTYVKYNNYCGYVNNDDPISQLNKAAQAFSHFSFERSRGTLLVSDIQGVGNRFSTPTIHTLDTGRFKLAGTNLHQEGFKFFFSSHVCNDICAKLDLKSTISGGVFRDNWPKVTDITICSNALCNTILNSETARRMEECEELNWCDDCLQQIDSSTVTVVCAGPGPRHEFEVSKFLYEAIGKIVPTKCEEHRGAEDITSEVAMQWRLIVSLMALFIGGLLLVFPGAITIV